MGNMANIASMLHVTYPKQAPGIICPNTGQISWLGSSIACKTESFYPQVVV
jgi:hypothetical protein